jgi:membrane-associated phospholipid phosphatase
MISNLIAISTLFKRLFFAILFLPTAICSQNLDIDILRAINSSEVKPADPIFGFISDTHAEISIAVPISLGIAGLINEDDKMVDKAIEISASIVINLGATYVLKNTINRDRPFITYPDITKKSDGGSPSFPSGHTSMAFATATSLSLCYPKWYVIVPSYLWAGTVGYSRMYLGVHYPSDVLAGAILGAGSAWITHEANKWLQSNKKKKNETRR